MRNLRELLNECECLEGLVNDGGICWDERIIPINTETVKRAVCSNLSFLQTRFGCDSSIAEQIGLFRLFQSLSVIADHCLWLDNDAVTNIDFGKERFWCCRIVNRKLVLSHGEESI